MSGHGNAYIQTNNPTMGLNPLLYNNILQSNYFKNYCCDMTDYPMVLNEIIAKVKSLEPFLQTTIPSTAFTLLFKLHTIKPTFKQLSSIINHKDSVHARCLGFLYLRYAAPPAELWEWFADYIDEETKVQVLAPPKKPLVMTIGQFVKSLLTEPKYLDTMLPRIPVPIARDIESKLREWYSSAAVPSGSHPDDPHEEDGYNDRGRGGGSGGGGGRYRSVSRERQRDRVARHRRRSRSISSSERARSGRRTHRHNRSRSSSRSRSRSRDGASRRRSRSSSRRRYRRRHSPSSSSSRSRSGSRDSRRSRRRRSSLSKSRSSRDGSQRRRHHRSSYSRSRSRSPYSRRHRDSSEERDRKYRESLV